MNEPFDSASPDRDDHAAFSPAERELEASLGRLPPLTPAIDRDQLLFAAGHAAGVAERQHEAGRHLAVWRAAAAVLLVVAGDAVLLRSPPRVVEHERVVHVTDPGAAHDRATSAPAPAQRTIDAASDAPAMSLWLPAVDRRPILPGANADYLSLRDAMLRFGVTALPAPAGAPVAAGGGADPTIDGLLGTTLHAKPPPSNARRWNLGKLLFKGDRS